MAKMLKHLLLPILVLSLSCVEAAFEHSSVVEISKLGSVQGILLEVEEPAGKVELFQGIRYGKADRFQKPQPADPWTGSGILNATSFQFACPQADYPISTHTDRSRGLEAGTSSEDCLFLNVFRPKPDPAHSGKDLLAVMIFFHGGSFESGTIFNALYDARHLAAQGQLLVVTVNYRLGPFGFLYGGGEEAGGNAGLYDQILSIKWVQENIHAFGGDKERVTIFGQSAGSMSAGALILSPLTQNLFRRAILQSGTPNSYFGSDPKEKSLNKAKVLAQKLNCTTENLSTMIQCLKLKPAQAILDHSHASQLNGESFVPTYGTEVMPLPPVDALKGGLFHKVDILYGVVRDEGAGFITKLLPMLDPDSDGHEMTVANVKTIIAFMYQMFQEPYYQEVADYYAKNLNESDKLQLRRTVASAFADYHLNCPTIFFGEAAAKFATGKGFYSYRVNLPPSIGVMGCHGWLGVCHGSDVVYLFGIPQRMRGIVFTEGEYELSRDMVHAWTEFAKHGNPGKMGPNKVAWTQALDEHHDGYTSHMALEPGHYEMVPNYYKEVCNGFWKEKLFK